MRSGFRTALICLVIWAIVPAAALAKGGGYLYATVDGPGLDHPVRLTSRFLTETFIAHMEGARHNYSDINRRSSEAANLGPRFNLIYHLQGSAQFHVDFYPYAHGGPVAFAVAGQRIPNPGLADSDSQATYEVPAGWFSYRPRLIAQLQTQGLPSRQQATDTESPLPWLFALTGLAVSLGALLIRSRYSHPAPSLVVVP